MQPFFREIALYAHAPVIFDVDRPIVSITGRSRRHRDNSCQKHLLTNGVTLCRANHRSGRPTQCSGTNSTLNPVCDERLRATSPRPIPGERTLRVTALRSFFVRWSMVYSKILAMHQLQVVKLYAGNGQIELHSEMEPLRPGSDGRSRRTRLRHYTDHCPDSRYWRDLSYLRISGLVSRDGHQ